MRRQCAGHFRLIAALMFVIRCEGQDLTAQGLIGAHELLCESAAEIIICVDDRDFAQVLVHRVTGRCRPLQGIGGDGAHEQSAGLGSTTQFGEARRGSRGRNLHHATRCRDGGQDGQGGG